MNVHFVQHEVFEAPGAYLDWAKQRKHNVTFSKVYENQPLPDTVDHMDLLIVMGGPQSPNTTRDECPHFDAIGEKALIRKAVHAGKAVIGVCLGSQLIGEELALVTTTALKKKLVCFPYSLQPMV